MKSHVRKQQKDRPFHVDTRMPGGNSSRVRFEDGDPPRFIFSADPKGSRPLWFYFRVKAREDAGGSDSDDKLNIVLDYYETLLGAESPRECMPVYMAAGQFWVRMSAGKVERSRDGRMRAVWSVNRNADEFEVALCYPYGHSELRQLVDKLRGSWRIDGVGLTLSGREIRRLSNSYEHSSKLSSGLYLVVRERGCDMPAAWLLDGLLQRLASVKNNPFVTWTVPLLDEDGARAGVTGSAPDLLTGWLAPVRHEVDVVKQDVALWRSCCKGALALSLRAADLRETKGIYCEVPAAEDYPEAHAEAVKWAHVIEHKLGRGFAADPFVRPVSAGRFHDWMAGASDIPALTVCVPWCCAGDTVLSPKKYREAGKSVADALIEKVR